MRRRLDSEAIRLLAARNSGIMLAPDYRAVPSIIVYRWNAKQQLGLIVKIDQTEALAPASAFGWSLVLIGCLALIAAMGFAFLLAKTITQPLRSLHEGMRRFCEGNFQEPLLECSNDEVGLLTHEFNQMAARIVERSAISKQLVTLMEGKIGVESEPGKGSTFWFTAQLEKQTGEAETRETSAPDQLPRRVLVVDDNHTNRQILRNQVDAWKMQVSTAASGDEALGRLRTALGEGQPYDVALLDRNPVQEWVRPPGRR
jgi:HAMP domain-containing protein